MEPEGRKKLTDGRIRFDFGRNFAGKIRIRVKGEDGCQVKITPGELLMEDGTIEQKFTGGPHYDVYTLAGEGEEVWMSALPTTGSVMRWRKRTLSFWRRRLWSSAPPVRRRTPSGAPMKDTIRSML
ncbi:MAG TPA: family 78 glycoside hydrolase catalytic domain [Candidatus Eisenbergiella intestinipullorum]|nr:family 78 glycoside hydrolase catalytic domain [Candidatus Eisenbergiella intestinipullorum]